MCKILRILIKSSLQHQTVEQLMIMMLQWMQLVLNFHNPCDAPACIYIEKNRNNYNSMQVIIMDFSHFYFIYVIQCVSYDLFSCASSHMTQHIAFFALRFLILQLSFFEKLEGACPHEISDIVKTITHRRGTKSRQKLPF